MASQDYKPAAQDFLKLASRGESRLAFNKYVGKGFIHHNAYFKGDGETLMLAMEESAKKMPDKKFEIKRILQDGNLVAVHSFVQAHSEDLGAVVMHIFRFENDKIMELWDFAQPIPKDIVNENGMI